MTRTTPPERAALQGREAAAVTSRDKLLSGAIIGAIGLLMAVVPAFDIWQDVFAEGKTPATALLENAPLLALSALVVAGGVWLVRSDLETRYARTVAKFTTANVAGVALLIALIVFIQAELQGDLKPLIIAADAVVIGALGGILVGVRTVQHKRAIHDAETQRQRAWALFDNHTDAVAAVTVTDDRLVVGDVNDEFRRLFGYRTDEIHDLRTDLMDDAGDAEAELRNETARGNQVRRELTLLTQDGERQFLVQSVPIGTTPETVREAYVVFTDITGQKQRERQLEFLNSLLRHDIQNAMTVIRARGEHLADTLTDDEAAFAATIVERSNDVIELTDRFRRTLDVLTDEADDDLAPAPVAEVIDEQAEVLASTYPDVSVTTDLPEGIQARVDDLFDHVVWNLLSNAVEHNDAETPEVTVTATERDGTVRIRFADNGPGIPDDLKDAVFRRDDGGENAAVGSGFGLFFVDTMIDRYGGTIRVEDNDPRGAAFVVRLPTS